MGWEDALTYNSDKIAATKANLTEVSTLINNRVQFINRTRGRLTLEEQELLLIKDKVDNRLADVQSILDVATVKTAIAGKTYEMNQTDVADGDEAEASIIAAIAAIIDELELNDVSYEIEKVSYTSAIAGTEGDANGTDGSFEFKVKLTKRIKEDETDTLTMTIKATPYSAG